ncbi:hypothetical protein, partial [Mycolicibacter kumamotonensis]
GSTTAQNSSLITPVRNTPAIVAGQHPKLWETRPSAVATASASTTTDATTHEIISWIRSMARFA